MQPQRYIQYHAKVKATEQNSKKARVKIRDHALNVDEKKEEDDELANHKKI